MPMPRTSNAHPQSQSPLFHALGPELRALIFLEVVRTHPDPLHHATFQFDNYYYRPGYTAQKRNTGISALLSCCKRVCAEAQELVWHPDAGNDTEPFWWAATDPSRPGHPTQGYPSGMHWDRLWLCDSDDELEDEDDDGWDGEYEGDHGDADEDSDTAEGGESESDGSDYEPSNSEPDSDSSSEDGDEGEGEDVSTVLEDEEPPSADAALSELLTAYGLTSTEITAARTALKIPPPPLDDFVHTYILEHFPKRDENKPTWLNPRTYLFTEDTWSRIKTAHIFAPMDAFHAQNCGSFFTRAPELKPTAVHITIRYTDWPNWETDQPLDCARIKPNPDAYYFPESVERVVLELETREGKRGEVEEQVERIVDGAWRWRRLDNEYLTLDVDEDVRQWEWIGTAKLGGKTYPHHPPGDRMKYVVKVLTFSAKPALPLPLDELEMTFGEVVATRAYKKTYLPHSI